MSIFQFEFYVQIYVADIEIMKRFYSSIWNAAFAYLSKKFTVCFVPSILVVVVVAIIGIQRVQGAKSNMIEFVLVYVRAF